MAIGRRSEQPPTLGQGLDHTGIIRHRCRAHTRRPYTRRLYTRRGAGRLMLAVVAVIGLGCASQPAVDVALVGLTPVESTLFEQRLRLDFRLQNFSERVIRATGFEISLSVNGRSLARGVDDGSFLLTGLSEARVSAVVSTSLFQVARQLLELRHRETFSYELSGRLHLDGWPRPVPFARTGEITRADLQRLAGTGDQEPQALTLPSPTRSP